MRRLLAPSVVLVVLALLTLAGCGTAGSSGSGGYGGSEASGASADADGSLSDGDDVSSATAPAGGPYDFTAETVGGETFEGASLQGKPTVLWFWAPWCSACRAQIDGVSALADDRAGAVNVVGVGGLDEAEAMGDFADDVASSEVTQLSDPDGEVWRRFGVTSQTTYVVLDSSGATVAQGYLADDELADLVAELVA